MHGFCDILIGLEDACYDFVDTNVQIIVDLLVNQYLSPEVICGEEFLGACPWKVNFKNCSFYIFSVK